MKSVTVAFAASVVFLQSLGAYALTERQDQMLAHLGIVQSIFYSAYAPAKWKREFANWSLGEEIAKIDRRVRAGELSKVKDFQRALRGFANSTRDYHVSVSFFAKEAAALPLQIKGAGDRFFLVHIDRDLLPESRFPFHEGDEVVRFGARPTLEAVRTLETTESSGNAETQRALSELTLTLRRAARGLEVPQGAIQLAILRKGETAPRTIDVAWEYTPESAAFLNDNTDPLDHAPLLADPTRTNSRLESVERLFKRRMASPVAAALSGAVAADNRYAIGAAKSYVPELGEKIFEYDQGFFHARIFRVEGGRTIGMIRIPSYEGDAPQTREFAQLVKLMEQRTDALVIDQVSNPGGSVPFLYSLAAMLSSRPLTTPFHHMALTQSDVVDAREVLAQISDDATAREVVGDTIGGYPVSHALVRRLADYSSFIVQQWTAGKRYTDPFYLVGVDKIEPSTQAIYSKPILVLVDNLDFSGGDFFPAILQDNRRAKILGTRTAGAGGYVSEVKMTNLMGIESITLTGSLAERLDHLPIENLGVTPDIVYRLSANDLQNSGAEFRRAILEALR